MSQPRPWPAFDAAALAGGVAPYLSAAEARYPDVKPGLEKRVVWHGAPETRTPWSVVFVHGFSGASEEIRPVPDRVAEALGANLHFTRLAGHGRPGAAMGEATLSDWMADLAEALAIGRAIGGRVLVIAVSTGATLATLAAHDPMAQGVAGMAFVSPNFRVRNPAARLLDWPLARHWLPLFAGRELGFTPHNDGHARHWTTRYPAVAVFPMAEALRAARRLPHEAAGLPALFLFDDGDRIVDHARTRAVADRWGAPSELCPLSAGPGDDPDRHVIAGAILSPAMTGPVTERIRAWARDLGAPLPPEAKAGKGAQPRQEGSTP